MSKKINKARPREIGRTKVEKKPLIDPRYKNLFWTIVFLVVLLIFFIINNTRETPVSGSYPPGYDAQKQQQELNKDIPEQVRIKK
jgi:uncharacterized integral membrane protein